MGNYRFQVLGPFRVPTVKKRGRARVECDQARDAVFSAAEQAAKGRFDVTKAIGCYVFGLSPAGGPVTRPYYVGKACDQVLYKRVFQPQDKRDLYDDIIGWFERATPFVYLLPLLTPGGTLARVGSNAARIRLAEQNLIGLALRVNADLWNVQHRVALESFTIEGISQLRGKPSEAARRFRAMMDRAPKKAAAPKQGEAAAEIDEQSAQTLVASDGSE